jgi:hypothetical protein
VFILIRSNERSDEYPYRFHPYIRLGMKTVRIFSDRMCLEGFKSFRIRVQIFNIRYRIRIRILKSHIDDVDIQSYPIRHG